MASFWARADRFDGRPRLILYHFMFEPRWDRGLESTGGSDDVPDLTALDLTALGRQGGSRPTAAARPGRRSPDPAS